MSSWGNNDNAANAPYWAVSSAIMNVRQTELQNSAPTAANVALLYGNTSADVYTTNQTIGLFAIDSQEIQAQGHGLGAHSGWNLKTTGSGGRAGRVQTETLVCLANVISDGDAQVYANVSITLSGPSNGSVVSGAANANSVTFSVSPTLLGNTAARLTYTWQVNNNTGGSWVTMSDGAAIQPAGVIKGGTTTDTLTITPWNTSANGYVFRAIVSAPDQGVSATSANGQITIF
jgi:hypothetical protein